MTTRDSLARVSVIVTLSLNTIALIILVFGAIKWISEVDNSIANMKQIATDVKLLQQWKIDVDKKHAQEETANELLRNSKSDSQKARLGGAGR